MTNPPPPAPVEMDFAMDFGTHDDGMALPPGADHVAGGGAWSLRRGHLARIDQFPVNGPAVVLVPSEQVLMLAVPLPPLGGTVRRREVLPFAIEERIAQPLDQVHVALGAEITPGVWLAGVVSHEVMAGWVALLARAGLARAAIVPDALCLPTPDEGCWSVNLADGRAIVRAADGCGFALPMPAFETAWRAAGEPACIAYGDALPPRFSAMPAVMGQPLRHHQVIVPTLNLRQGLYAPPRRPINPLWRRAALIAGIGALAHGVIAIADTAALTHLAHVRQAQVRALAAGLQPPVVLGADLGDALGNLTRDATAAGPSRFMVLLSRSAAAIGNAQTPTPNAPQTAPQTAVQPGTMWRSMSFDQAAGTLTIEIEATDIAQLQQIAQGLTRAGLNALPGAASSEGGHAVGTFVIRAQ